MLAGYELVLGGRERSEALDLSLQLERGAGASGPRVEVWLVARSRWPEELVLLPGALVLSVLRTEMDSRARSGDRAVLLERDPGTELRVPGGGSARWSLGSLEAGVAERSLASRLRVDLRAENAYEEAVLLIDLPHVACHRLSLDLLSILLVFLFCFWRGLNGPRRRVHLDSSTFCDHGVTRE